ncbi:hypothetical protein ANN_24471 [Periplaneta americana]|uniref:Uncharacterized protein n=1 Tax=Periplaneta americana TaxID=6978 RepID=A0ABQ8S3G9_PERAM|nr:hypothetical protein ANN_24471 [Periplaneta americana]
MAGICEGGNEPSGSLKAICKRTVVINRAVLAFVKVTVSGEHSVTLPENVFVNWESPVFSPSTA